MLWRHVACMVCPYVVAYTLLTCWDMLETARRLGVLLCGPGQVVPNCISQQRSIAGSMNIRLLMRHFLVLSAASCKVRPQVWKLCVCSIFSTQSRGLARYCCDLRYQTRRPVMQGQPVQCPSSSQYNHVTFMSNQQM